MDQAGLKFAPPFQSFFDTSFFREFANLKLNVLKLNAEKIPLYTTVDLATIPKGASVAHLFFNSRTLDEAGLEGSGIRFHGWFHNFNTLGEFKILDKKKFLQDEALSLMEAGSKGCLDDAVGFVVIAYADLKNYKFYYWFAVPTFQSVEFNMIKKEQLEDKSAFHEFLEDDSILCGILDPNEGNVLKGYMSELKLFDTLVVKDTSKIADCPTSLLKNFLSLWKSQNPGKDGCKVILLRNENSFSVDVSFRDNVNDGEIKTSGWERNVNGKLTPKFTDLRSSIDPSYLAEQSLDLNLSLMKWRQLPDLDLQSVKSSKALLLGAGTLGCNVARSLLAWGVQTITFVDNGTVSVSNPARQSLYTFEDRGLSKAETAAKAVKSIYPTVNASGINLEIPMIGHQVTEEAKQREYYETLVSLFATHDVIFLLTDSRETRWLPTLLGNISDKLVINAALGFDSYLVMRHGNYEQSDGTRLGCYFCHDVVAPSDSLTDRTLDEMCTVTRPGVALMASAQAVELAVSVLQHPEKNNSAPNATSILGEVPHQIRGFLSKHNLVKLHTPAYKHCAGCNRDVIDALRSDGWQFLKQALNDYKFIERLSGLSQVQQDTEKILNEMEDLNFGIQ
ncbi:HEL098Cp [Eremothecium sinecaudum]|uniref:Ubiquitin-like modifier-activating enzyme ATG7 n=1 Tax=Eremothecium sinecaudum TaxID=45286 RepID=A0A120K2D6_9SACH|nr:HEL098Cp [Eremothecium sinecaudum]AMD21182.1 HEL098Cp [Eremothecium sinecaudum]